MKTVVSVNEITELEIKPRNELNLWKKSVTSEIENHWNNSEKLQLVPCPVCNSKQADNAFVKIGFQYVECKDCKTIYATPRPGSEELSWWYHHSESVKYWHNNLLKSSSASRKAKIVEPRAQWIFDGISEYIRKTPNEKLQLTDISFFGAALVDVLAESADNINITSAGILSANETYTQKATVKPISFIDNPAELDETDVLVAIDVLDRVQNIKNFFSTAAKSVRPGGIFFGTCPVSSGFEIQSLWQYAPSIIPPDKLNLPSIQALIKLFEGSDQWEILELSTPGMFDVESVKHEMANVGETTWPRSLHVLLDNINKQGIGLFTEYLQSQRLSSFARLVLRRTGNKIY